MLKERGLELMTSDELVAMIPGDEDFARNRKGWGMPFPPLLEALQTRTRGASSGRKRGCRRAGR